MSCASYPESLSGASDDWLLARGEGQWAKGEGFTVNGLRPKNMELACYEKQAACQWGYIVTVAGACVMGTGVVAGKTGGLRPEVIGQEAKGERRMAKGKGQRVNGERRMANGKGQRANGER